MRRPVAAPPEDPAELARRRYTEKAPATRTEAQRDRDRILYSSALLRLGHVTQVASPEIGHIFHSRLTHSLKVAQVARRLVERLKTLQHKGRAAKLVEVIDPDAVEAAALAHDLGHPPFGHLAEQELNAAARGFGGFEGNPQSFRILTRLSIRTVAQPGLNLTRQTLNGILKYPWTRDLERDDRSHKWGAYDSDRDYFDWTRRHSELSIPSLEARIMDWADDVTYAVHDMDDFYRAGLVPLDRLVRLDEELSSFQSYLAAKDAARSEQLTAAAERVFSLAAIRTAYQGRLEERAHLRALGSLLITRYINAFRVVNQRGSDTALRALFVT